MSARAAYTIRHGRVRSTRWNPSYADYQWVARMGGLLRCRVSRPDAPPFTIKAILIFEREDDARAIWDAAFGRPPLASRPAGGE